MQTSTISVIETHGLSKTYRGVSSPGVQALQPLDLQVREHSICGFLGPNGAGKTTTIKLLLGLARPTGGSGRVFGMDIEKENDEIRRRSRLPGPRPALLRVHDRPRDPALHRPFLLRGTPGGDRGADRRDPGPGGAVRQGRPHRSKASRAVSGSAWASPRPR